MKHLKYGFVGILAVGLALMSTLLRAETAVQIRHSPLMCTVREQPVMIPFTVLAPAPPAEVRVYFKSSGTNDYYFVQAPGNASGQYTALLPSPKPDTTIIDYLLLVVEHDGQVVKTERFSTPVDAADACPQYRSAQASGAMMVFAEKALPPEMGFMEDTAIWETMSAEARPLLETAANIMLMTDESAERHDEMTTAGRSGGFGKKTLLGLGLGAGAAAGAAIALGSGGDDGGDSDGASIDDLNKNIIAQVTKTPAVQTKCGVSVTNQLIVTNKTAAAISLGTIDYEVTLTKDKPAGSCVSGRSGGFAPDGVEIIAPGQTALVRIWENEVNPCASCPYVSAECVWESRYVVHTSAGSALARSTFSTQGNLCGSNSQKASGISNLINPD